jgi:uncharacterized cofD-like protein
MRRTLIALTRDEDRAGALAAPVRDARLGQHPLGNLLLCSLTRACGDLETASRRLGEELGVSARVLPAAAQSVSLIAASNRGLIRGESAIGASGNRIETLSFDPEQPAVPSHVIEAIDEADWVLLGPGSLFTSVLAVGALPAIRSAVAHTGADVLWICNLTPQIPETAGMSAADHLAALRRHAVRVDRVLYDPAAALHFTPSELITLDLNWLARPLVNNHPDRHDPALLADALRELFSRVPAHTEMPRSEGEHLAEMRPLCGERTRCDIDTTDAYAHQSYPEARST